MARLIVKNGFKLTPLFEEKKQHVGKKKILLREEIASPLNFLTFFLPRFSPSHINYLFIFHRGDKWKLRTAAKLRAVSPAYLSCTDSLKLESLPGTWYLQRAKQEQAKHPEKELLGNGHARSTTPRASCRIGKRGEQLKEQYLQALYMNFMSMQSFLKLKLQKGTFLSIPLTPATTSRASYAKVNLASTLLMLQFWSTRKVFSLYG